VTKILDLLESSTKQIDETAVNFNSPHNLTHARTFNLFPKLVVHKNVTT
jgi:hypothetical protein